MRERKEIEDRINPQTHKDLQMEVLLDIRELLESIRIRV